MSFRLTERQSDDRIAVKASMGDLAFRLCAIEDHFEKYGIKTEDDLGEFFRRMDKGCLRELPVAEGTDVYVIVTLRGGYFESTDYTIITLPFKLDMLSDVGKTVFIEKDSAFTALNELKKLV